MKKEDSFRFIAKNVLDKIYSSLPGHCPDQYVAKIESNKSSLIKIQDLDKDNFFKDRVSVFEGQTCTVENIPETESIMILILESPHKDEYKSNGAPKGPAMGGTGINIQKHILNNFEKRIKNFQNYHLVLMNAIPFQCSLGVIPPGSIRDTVFATAWNEKNQKIMIGKSFFKERLKNLLNKALEGEKKDNKEVVIVNACTKDKNKKGRKQKVSNAIKNTIRKIEHAKIEVWEAPHPSSKSWCCGENIEKIYSKESEN